LKQFYQMKYWSLFVIVILFVFNEAISKESHVRNVHSYLEMDSDVPSQVLGTVEGVFERKGRKRTFDKIKLSNEAFFKEYPVLSVRKSERKKFSSIRALNALPRKGSMRISFPRDIMDESMEI
jgi:hypothetical protein